ncbi:MAG: hypothetical protein GY953_02435 [bacterium]|nr:hypothetical protein [bacterium]
MLELDSRKSTQVLHMGAPPYSGAPDARWSSRISPGGRWIAFKEDIAPNRSRIFVAPLEDSAQPTKRKWQPVTKGISWDDKPRWSPDGNMIYFTSDRDGFRCIWACRLEPASKQPLGDPFPVHHFHQLRPSMLTVDRDRLGLAVAPDRLIFPLNEMTGNIWMMEPAEE